MIFQSSTSLEYVIAGISAQINGFEADPTSDAVSFAFMAEDVKPTSGDFHAGSWYTANGLHYAQILVGPGGTITLAVGRWHVWVKVTDSPEVPIHEVDILVIT